MSNVFKKINGLWKLIKHQLYVFLYPINIKVQIYPYDCESKIIAEQFEAKIHSVAPQLLVHFIGSSSLKIAGCKDIDLFIECGGGEFERYLPKFKTIFGEPSRSKKGYVEWEIEQAGWEIDVLLIDPTTEKFQDQMQTFLILQRNESLRSEYEKLKWNLNGFSIFKYEFRKGNFIGKIMKNEKASFSFSKNPLHENFQTSKLLSVSIGIPAYNEAANIGLLLKALEEQAENGFQIVEIVVISDGSNDGTNRAVEDFMLSCPKIKLMTDERRLGKSARINEFFEKTQSDVAVLLDADIKLGNENVITELLRPLVEDENIMHVSGYALPLPPKKIAEKIAYAGTMLWENARRLPIASPLYYSEGSIRAFRQKVYKKLRFPKASADEAFSILYCEKEKYLFAWAEKAAVFYQLPKTFLDYIYQMKRFLKSNGIQGDIFDEEFIEKYYNIGTREKLQALMIALRKNFWWTLAYLSIIPLPRLLCLFDSADSEGIWSSIRSTKILNGFAKKSEKTAIIFSNYDDIKNPWYGGGGAKAVHEVAKRLVDNFEITVITGKYPGSADEEIDGLKYKRIGTSIFGPKFGQIIFALILPWYAISENFEIWIENLTPPFGPTFTPLVTRRPVVGLVHMLPGMDMWRKYKLPFFLFERIGLKFYRSFIVLTQESKKTIQKYAPKKLIKVIPNGVDLTSSTKIKNDSKNILFLGRIEIDQKGLDILLKSFERAAENIQSRLIIAGNGSEDEMKKLKSMVAKSKFSARIDIIGRVSEEKKAEIFEDIACVVVSSRFETFSLVALEAFSYGIPVITFDLENLKWIPENCAIKVPQFQEEALAKAMEKMILDSEMRESMSIKAREFAEGFSWDKIASQYVEYINSMIKK